jgi:hypothetical protein
MDTGSSRRGRGALLAISVAIAAAMVAPPAVACAKTTTRILVKASKTVSNTDPLVDPWPAQTLSATLQKRITSTRYHGLSGTVRLYKYNLDTHVYDYTGLSRKSSSTGKVTFPIGNRGKYRFYYAGSSTMKAATKYSTVFEDIGLTVSTPDQPGDITFTQIGTTDTFWVNVVYTVGWNTSAWDPTVPPDNGSVTLDMEAFFRDEADTSEGDWVWYRRDFMEPGPVEFNFKVDVSQVTGFKVFDTSAFAYVDDIWDPYIVPFPNDPAHPENAYVTYYAPVTPVHN